jgi:hypothetical protein
METHLHDIESSEKAAMQWLINAYSHGQGGFPHSRWMFLPAMFAWNKEYAETTGYLLENLLEYNTGIIPGLREVALSAGDWLLRIQSKEGYYHSGTRFVKPSAFNTAQVLFGLDKLYKHTKDEKYIPAIAKAYEWMLLAIGIDGKMHKGLYVDDYYPAYYARAIWPMILIDQKYYNSVNQEKILRSMELLFSYKNAQGFFDHSSFYPGKVSSLHTVAYTLEGFYESSKLCDHYQMRKYILEILDRFCQIIQTHKKSPGYIHNDFKPDFSFVCVSGQAQVCALLLKAYNDHGKTEYRKAARILFLQLLDWQIKSSSIEHNGAFPSSIPVWRHYFPFRYTNWTVKFFLDGCSLLKKTYQENT